MSIKVYTAITGGFESERTDIPCYFNYDRFVSPRMNAKIYKVLPQLFFSDEITVWLDGNIFLQQESELFIRDFLGDADMAVFEHPGRNCIYQEGALCHTLGLDNRSIIRQQLEHYLMQEYPKDAGLAECGVLVRRNTDLVNAFNLHWWGQICRWSSRDQISFMYSLSKFRDLKVRFNPSNARWDPRFKYITRPSSKS